jgi:hypothetical protein
MRNKIFKLEEANTRLRAKLALQRSVINDLYSQVKTCSCEEMRHAIARRDIEKIESNTLIYGRPRYDDDGDGYHDDTTRSIKITYCPFCGKLLQVTGDEDAWD